MSSICRSTRLSLRASFELAGSRPPLPRLSASANLARADFLQHLRHALADAVVDDPAPAEQRAELGGVGDRLAHAGDAARLDQVGDQLQLTDAFQIGELRRNAGLDQSLVTRDQQFGHAAPHHRLLVEQIGFGFLGEARSDEPGAAAPDRAAVGEGDARARCPWRPAPPPRARSCPCPPCRASAARSPVPLARQGTRRGRRAVRCSRNGPTGRG